jgi:SAM-dependent methyltransferase
MSANPAEHYVGNELELFAEAGNWKRYFASKIRPHLGADVAEVGAGIGGTTALLSQGHQGHWLCLEPDRDLLARIEDAVARGELPGVDARAATLAELPADRLFDTILYIDVLEHIDDDRGEAARASAHLRPGGKLVILSPAHQWLYSPFDRAIGHFRRYTKASLAAAVPEDLARVELLYLDMVGLLASAGNRFITSSAAPSRAQIKLWDGVMVPLSRLLDRVVGHTLGKSVMGVWAKRPE